MISSKKNWKIDLKKKICRNDVIGIEVSFIITNENKLFGNITRTDMGLHQYIAKIECDLEGIPEQLINLARYYFAKKYYKKNNPYENLPNPVLILQGYGS
ncbi:hypothetical protein [Treponema primitia]|uniref:hypothetical protein n=1 Tax=Treponema primitia TaxID=88058 RepID=UPI00025551F5|nr:hypothetical protein [Treponema primitia]